MADWRPLSRRSRADPEFDEFQDGLPDYLLDPILAWTETFLWDNRGQAHVSRLEEIQVLLHHRLAWSAGPRAAVRSLLGAMTHDSEFALDVVDLILGRWADPVRLNSLLEAGGSVWVAQDPENNGSWRLMRRSLGPIIEAIGSIQPASERAHQHLVRAWTKLGRRDPDAPGAYREAVRAVEAVAKPVVLPNDNLATLGKAIRAIRDKPEKWTFVLGDPVNVADVCDLLWTAQLDRHGTDDDSIPLDVSLEQADAAVHLAITLVRFFAGGLFRLK
jgi:hypothetical protein